MSLSKIGRNDPCPCGSGKKYKQCCQQKSALQIQPDPQQTVLAVRRGLQAAWQYRQQGNLAQAELVCGQILQMSPNQPDALNLLGAMALQNGKIESAIDLIGKALRKNAYNPEYYNNLGLAYHEQGRLDLAIDQYRKSIRLDPRYADAHYNLHALLLNADDPQPAIQSLEKVVEINPADVDAHFMLGALLEQFGQDEEAAANHFAQVEQGPAIFRARLDAWRYLRSASPKLLMTGSMMQTFKRCLEAAPHDGLVLEFGVRHGNSIRQIAGLVKQQVHGFDSFEGLPEDWHHEPRGSYTTKGEIPKVPANVELHAGWFEDALPKFLEQHEGAVRFINVDCDIYSSTKTVLDLLAPRMVAGSVIVFDEYIGNEHWREDEFKAFQEAVASYGWGYEYLCFSLFTKQVAVQIKSV